MTTPPTLDEILDTPRWRRVLESVWFFVRTPLAYAMVASFVLVGALILAAAALG